MNAVGIDVSKGKSTVAIYRPGDQVILSPRNFHHTQTGINSLIEIIKGLDGETKVCMEHTGRYYEPVATLFIASLFWKKLQAFLENVVSPFWRNVHLHGVTDATPWKQTFFVKSC